MEPLNLSIADTAHAIGVSRTLLYQMVADGRFGPKIYKTGRRSLINKLELEDWANSGMLPRDKWLKVRRPA